MQNIAIITVLQDPCVQNIIWQFDTKWKNKMQIFVTFWVKLMSTIFLPGHFYIPGWIGVKQWVAQCHDILVVGKPRDANRLSSGPIFFLSHPRTHDGSLYYILVQFSWWRPTKSFGEKGKREFISGVTGNKCQILMELGIQRPYWGTGNIRKQIIDFGD